MADNMRNRNDPLARYGVQCYRNRFFGSGMLKAAGFFAQQSGAPREEVKNFVARLDGAQDSLAGRRARPVV